MAHLAIRGGAPVRTKPFPSWTICTPSDERGMIETYSAKSWGADGERNRAFRQTFEAYAGVKHCLTVANGTVAIELILRALNLGRGDEVIVPPYTFIASISALIYAGVTPVFADIDRETFLLSPESAERAITPRTKAIMPVYVGGRPADLDAYEALCKKYGLYFIGDGAQAVGSEFNGKGIGNYGIATSISCQNSKNLSAGEGGLILTNDDDFYARVLQILHGGRDAQGRYGYLGLENGMSEFQASILSTQLEALPGQITRRMENAAYLTQQMNQLEFVYPLKEDARITRNSHHIYMFGLREELLKGVTRDAFIEAVEAEGVELNPGYAPLYDFPCLASEYTQRCIGGSIDLAPDTPVTELISRHEGCWILQYVLLGEREDMDDIIRAMSKVYAHLDELA